MKGLKMELTLPASMWKLSEVCQRTGLSRSALYREIKNPKSMTGEVRENPTGRLKVVHIGRYVRVREQDLVDFLDALARS
jgi:AraC-like DNA-binding protein